MHDSIEKTLKKIGKNKTKKLAIGAAGVIAYKSAKDGGETEESAKLSAFKEGAAATLLSPTLYYPMKFGAGLAEKGVRELAKLDQTARKYADGGTSAAFSSKTFMDNKQLFTMRQAGMALIQQAKYNAADAMIGNEAAFMHR